MSETASSILNLRLMAQGSSTEWGTKTNTNMQIVEAAIAGTLSLTEGSFSGGSVTLSDADYTLDQAKNAVIYVSSTNAARTVVIPNASRMFTVVNASSYGVDVKTSSGSAKTITAGAAARVYCDGSNNVLFVGPQTVTGTGAPQSSSGAVASSVSVSATGNLSSTNAQAAFEELQTDINTINSSLSSSYQPLDADLTAIAALSRGKGSIIVGTDSAWSAQSVGTDGLVLVANSAESTGVKWASPIPTGTIMDYLGTTAPSGWVLLNGLTIGNSSSSATGRANADTETLFTLLWNSTANAQCPVSSGRGASAAADFAANKTLTLPDASGRARFGKDDMSGSAANRITSGVSSISGATLAASGGAQSHTLTEAQLPVITPAGTVSLSNAANVRRNVNTLANVKTEAGGSDGILRNGTEDTITASFTGTSFGSGSAHPIMPPALIVNVIIKL